MMKGSHTLGLLLLLGRHGQSIDRDPGMARLEGGIALDDQHIILGLDRVGDLAPLFLGNQHQVLRLLRRRREALRECRLLIIEQAEDHDLAPIDDLRRAANEGQFHR
jgi:hypothetical protein